MAANDGADSADHEGTGGSSESGCYDFSVVGVGASAGGLAAIEALFSAMLSDEPSGLAFIIVQHLSPDHQSILCELVRRHTRMQVFEAADGLPVQPDCAYIIPPNHDLVFRDGRLHLTPPSEARGLRLPVDILFRSLAAGLGERAIGIVLSGTGSDGTLGLKEIKGRGGMAMVQDPATADFDGMPRSALATGLVDYVLPPAEMPAKLLIYVRRAYAPRPEAERPVLVANTLQQLFGLLQAGTGHDFSHYKSSTILRRIERRLAVHQLDSLEEYVRYLRERPQEVAALFRDLLIGVTSFFRDPEAFDALDALVLRRLVETKAPGDPLRIWVPACSSGEEAFSIAMLVQEQLETAGRHLPVQIFATDIDSEAICRARAAVYPPSIVPDVSAARLARQFVTDESGSYRVQRGIRDLVVCAEQDVIADPPFSRLDLISCRNLLIYLSRELQQRVLALFHYALRDDGHLFLGSAESLGELASGFAVVDRQHKLYRREGAAPGASRVFASRIFPEPGAGPPRSDPSIRGGARGPRELTEQTLLERCVPAAVLINERSEIVYIHGRTGQFLEPAPGEAGINLIQMAREGLRTELAGAIRRVLLHGEPVVCSGLLVRPNGAELSVDLTAQRAGPEHLLVTFESRPAAIVPTAGASEAELGPASEERIMALERALHAKEVYLQAAIEELEASNEELQSTTEEVRSANEELQSSNEELQTSKEELQSVNEELATVNAELQERVDELSRANNDMNNLLAGTGVGTVFVDHSLRIVRFTPAATPLINLIQTDLGRPVGHIATNLTGYDRLVEDVREVLDTLVPRDVEVQTRAGAWYLARMRPYRTLSNVIEGAVITFIDVTEQKRAREVLHDLGALQRLAAVVRDSRDAVITEDFNGRILAWNGGAERLYGWTEAEALALEPWARLPAADAASATALAALLQRAEHTAPVRTQRLAKDGRRLDVWVAASLLQSQEGPPYAVATTEWPAGASGGQEEVG